MKKTKILDLYIFILAIGALIVSGLRTYALLAEFNSLTMHFESSIAIVIANVITAIAVIGFGSYLIFGIKGEDLIAKTDNAASYIPAGIVSVAMLFMGVTLISETGFMPMPMLRSIALVCALLAFLSVGSFFLSIFIEKKQDLYKAAFSLCIVFFLSAYAVFLFFNKEVHPTNSPNKLVDQMAYIFSAIFFLYETRISLGRAKWREYTAFGLTAAFLAFYSAIPSIIVYAVNGYVVSNSLIESALTLALAVFITSKVWQTKNLTPNEKCEAAAGIEALAMMREEEIEEQHKLSRAHASNNMEENDDTKDAANYTFDIPYVETFTDFNAESGETDLPHYSE